MRALKVGNYKKRYLRMTALKVGNYKKTVPENYKKKLQFFCSAHFLHVQSWKL